MLTAAPVGFLFGFLLQKGDLCGASAFSEVILARDGRKTFGLWVAIVVSMLGFALIEALGWVQLAPKPMLWVNDVVGGALFGAGTVLAGGCISGCLFKAGAGNLNSMAALTGMPLGIAMVEFGVLNALHRSMMTHVVASKTGGPVTLASVTGLPYWGLAIGIAGATAAGVVVHRARRRSPARTAQRQPARHLLTGQWKPWQAGLAIGLLAVLAYLSSAATGRNYPLGVTHGVVQAYQAVTDNQTVHVWKPAPPPSTAPAPAATSPVTAQAAPGRRSHQRDDASWEGPMDCKSRSDRFRAVRVRRARTAEVCSRFLHAGWLPFVAEIGVRLRRFATVLDATGTVLGERARQRKSLAGIAMGLGAGLTG